MLARRSILLTLLSALAACANPQPGLAPPGLSDTGPAFAYPVAVAVDPTGANIYVASSNFDRQFTSGWVSQFPTTLFDRVSDGSVVKVKPSEALSVGNIDTFAGTMLLKASTAAPTVASRLFITTREYAAGKNCSGGNQCGALTSVALNPSNGNLLCTQAGCSIDAVDLTSFSLQGTTYQMSDPFAMAFVPQVLLPNGTRVNTVAVTNMSPSSSGQPGIGVDAVVAFIQMPDEPPVSPSTTPFSQIVSAVKIGNVGANSLAVANGVIYAGGCFTRVPGETIVPCLADPSITQYRLNPLRYFFGGALDHSTVDVASLGAFFAGGQTKDIAVSNDGTQLYVATSLPNALLVIDTPRPGSPPIPTLRATIPLANEPNRLLVLPAQVDRPELVAVTTADPNVVLSNSSALLLVDPQAGVVRAQVEPLSRTPFGMAVHTSNDHYRIFVTLFGACGVAAIDVPFAAPEAAKHVSTVGSCK